MTLTATYDVDYAIWGPYLSLNDAHAINNCGSLPPPIDCSFSNSNIESPTIPSSSTTGHVYVMMITNYANKHQMISNSKAGGPGSTDCTKSLKYHTIPTSSPTSSPSSCCSVSLRSLLFGMGSPDGSMCISAC